MKKTVFSILILSVLFFTSSCARKESLEAGKATASALIKILPENTTALSVFDLKKITSIEAVQKFLGQPEVREKYDNLLKETGVDLIKNAYFILISSQIIKDQPLEVAVLVNLKYNRDVLWQKIKSEIQTLTEEIYQDIPILGYYETKSLDEDTLKFGLAFLDNSNLVVGTARALKSTIDVYKKQAKSVASNAQLMSYAKKIDKNAMTWGTMVLPQEFITQAIAANPTLKLIEGVSGISYSANYQNRSLAFQLVASGGTEEQNKNLATALNGFKMVGAASISGNKTLADAANAIEISSGKDYTKIYASFSDELLNQLTTEAQSNIQSIMPQLPAKVKIH